MAKGSVHLRKDGRWEGHIVVGYDERGYPKTKNVLAKTKRECQKKLRVLEQKGYLMTKRQREGNMPEKSIYSLTREGRKYFHELMHEISAQTFEILFDFNAVVVSLNKVDKEEGLECVQRIAQSLQDTRTYLSMQRDAKKEIPYVGRSILEQQLSVCETLLTWCHTLCEELKSSDGLEKMKELP